MYSVMQDLKVVSLVERASVEIRFLHSSSGKSNEVKYENAKSTINCRRFHALLVYTGLMPLGVKQDSEIISVRVVVNGSRPR